MSEWVAECGRPVAWLSLDSSHNDTTSFVTYVVAALQTVSSSLGSQALDILHAPQMPGLEQALTVLINDISALVNPVILETVREANLFMIPLDNERRWYRYHHLFSKYGNISDITAVSTSRTSSVSMSVSIHK